MLNVPRHVLLPLLCIVIGACGGDGAGEGAPGRLHLQAVWETGAAVPAAVRTIEIRVTTSADQLLRQLVDPTQSDSASIAELPPGETRIRLLGYDVPPPDRPQDISLPPSFASDTVSVSVSAAGDTDAGEVLLRAQPFLAEPDPAPSTFVSPNTRPSFLLVTARGSIDRESIRIDVGSTLQVAGGEIVRDGAELVPCDDAGSAPCAAPPRGLRGWRFRAAPDSLIAEQIEIVAVEAGDSADPPRVLAFSYELRTGEAVPTVTPTSSMVPTTAPTGTLSPSPTTTATSVATATTPPSPTATEVATATPVAPTQTTTATASASPSPTATGVATPSATAAATATSSSSPTDTARPTESPTPSPTQSATVSPTDSATATPTLSATATPTLSATATVSRTQTPTPSSSATPSLPPTASTTPTASVTPTATATPTSTATQPPTATATATFTSTATATRTATETPTASPTPTPTATPTATATPTPTSTPTSTPTATATSSSTPSPTATSAVPFDGEWQGTTSQGRPLDFTIVGNRVISITVGYDIREGFCQAAGSVTVEPTPALLLTDGSFAIDASVGGTNVISFTVEATLLTNDLAAGDAEIRLTRTFPSVPTCSATVSVSWEAEKTGPTAMSEQATNRRSAQL